MGGRLVLGIGDYSPATISRKLKETQTVSCTYRPFDYFAWNMNNFLPFLIFAIEIEKTIYVWFCLVILTLC